MSKNFLGEPTSPRRTIIVVGLIFFGLYAFMFRDIIFHLPQLLSGEMVINGDELVPFFNPDSQFLDQVKGNFNELTHGYEFRVRYSFLTTWMRYYKVLPFALLLVIPSMAFISYLTVSRFLAAIFPDVPRPTIYRASSAPILFIFLVLTYTKVTHFYTLIFGFSIYLITVLLLVYGLIFERKRPYRFITLSCLVAFVNPAVHYIILFALFMGLFVVGLLLVELFSYLGQQRPLRKKLRRLTIKKLLNRIRQRPKPLLPFLVRELINNRRQLIASVPAKGIGAFILLGCLTIIPYGLFVKFFVLNGISNLSETIPVNYYFIKDASVSFLHLISFDLAGIMDKFIAGDYLTPHPRLTNLVYTGLMFLPLLMPNLRRKFWFSKPHRTFFIVSYGILFFSFWATLGFSGSDSLPTFHRIIALISNVANATQTMPGDLVVKLMGTIVQVLRFPHRFQLIMFMMACILMPIAMIWVDEAYRAKLRAASPARNRRLLNPLLYILFFIPLLASWQYYETFLSGNFLGFLSPYPVGPLKEVKEFLLELPEGKTIVLPPTESAKRIIDVNGVEHKFIDKFHIYYLDLPSYYYGLSGDARNKQEFFLLLRAMYYDQDWWVNIARDNSIKYIIVNKELVANTVGGAEYLRDIEKKLLPQLEGLDQYFRKIFENESYVLFEFIDLPTAARVPLYVDGDWNTFIRILSSNLDLTKYYDLQYGMVPGDLAEYESLTVVSDDLENTAVDLYLKAHEDSSFRPSSTIFAFNPDIIPSTYYFAPVFRMFQFFSDSKWNRLDMITPGLFGTVTGGFIGLPRSTDFRIDITLPETGDYRLLMSSASTANRLLVDSQDLDLNKELILTSADTDVVFFEQDKVFAADRTPYDVTEYTIEELEKMIPTEIVAVNYGFRYIDLGTVTGKKGSHTIYFEKQDQNPMLVENILLIPEAVYQSLTLPDNVTVIDSDDGLCCGSLPIEPLSEFPSELLHTMRTNDFTRNETNSPYS